MTYIAARYKLPADVRRDFDRRYKKALESAPTGPTAGRLARFFTMMRGTQTNYTGRATQERLFTKSLRRVKPDCFAEHDMQDVCQFLATLENGDWQLRKKFITQGARRFPDCARLRLLAGELEMEQGPFMCDFEKAREHMQRALDLAQGSRRAADTDIVERGAESDDALEQLDAIPRSASGRRGRRVRRRGVRRGRRGRGVRLRGVSQ